MIKRLLILLAIIFLCAPFAAFSTHIVGGTLTYVYNGGSSYTVTLKLFRDCSPTSAAFPGSVTINVTGYNGASFTPSKDFTMNLGTVTLVPPTLDPCAIPPSPLPCVQQGVYTTTVNDLPPNPGGYHMYYQVVARNLSLTNINATCNCVGESFYAYIPGESVRWFEDFTLPNNTTSDAGPTAWTIAAGVPAPASASVMNNYFEITGANNARETWTSQTINISACTSTNISVDLSENGTLDPNDSIFVYYRLNGGPLTLFSTNGFIADDFTNAIASVSGLSGTTVQIIIRVHYDGNSPASENYRIDNVAVSCNDFLPNSNPVFNLFPPLFLCVGQPFTFDHSATDADGDSLYYSFYTPYNGDNGVGPLDPTYAANTAIFTPVVWQPGFSATNPLGGPALTLNPNTGLLTGTPTLIGQFVVGIMVKDYRHGNYMSQTLRDFQFNIVSCPPPPVTVAGNDITINDGCIGHFNAVGFNTPTVTWNSIFPGAPGAYNSYLSCTSACLNPAVQSTGTPPPYVDYVICGISATCNPTLVCDTVRVNFNPTLAVTIAPINPTICFGATSIVITATGSGGTAPYSYLWNGVNPSPSITVGAGNFTVQLSDASGCPPTTASVTVTQFTVPITANAGPDDTVCSQSPSTILNGSVTGATGGIWSGGAGTFSPNNTTLAGAVYTPTAAELAAGVVNLTLTTTGNGTCPAATDVVTIHYMGFTGTVTATPTNISCFGGNNGSATASVTGGISPYTYLWNTVPPQTTATATNLSIGTYTVTIHNGIGCSTQTSVTITQPAPISLNNVVTDVTCSGASTGSIAITPVGGTPPYTYLWAPGGQTTSTISGQAAGTYTVTVTDSKGCVFTSSYTINQPPALTITFTHTNVSCFGGSSGSASATVTGGTGPYTYHWTPSGGTAATATGLHSGTYTLTVTDSRGCVVTNTVTITQPAALTATTSHTNETCSYSDNGTATANPTGGTPAYTYLWQPGSLTGATVNSLASGTYTLTVTDANGCSATAFAAITQPPVLTVNFTGVVDVKCFGGSTGSVHASPAGGTAPYTYSWAPGGATTPTISGLAAGTYTVTITDSHGCQVINSTTITQPAAPLSVAMSSTPVSCFGLHNGTATANPSGGTAPYTYHWLPGGSTASSISGLAAGTYTVTVKDANLCSSTVTVVVTQPAAITLTTSTVNSNCGTPSGQASVAVSGGVSPYTYLWSPSGGTSDTATSLLSGAYTVQVTDANGCSATQWANINDNSGPTATIFSITNVSCFGGSNGAASVGVAGGTGPFTYTWTPFGGSAPTATGLTAGTYTVTVLDANGCLSNATTSPAITEPPPIVITVTTSDVNCFGGNDGSANVSASGGTPGYAYTWLPSGIGGSSISSLTAGTYTVQATDAHSCVQSSTFSIIQPTTLSASISSSSNVSCFGGSNGSATVSASGGTPVYSYNWLPYGGSAANATGLSAGTFTVTITDANNCTTSATVVITEPSSALTATSSGSSTSCFGGSDGTGTVLASGGTPGYAYSWSPSGGTGATASGLNAGTYFVIVTDLNGCQANTFVTIAAPSQLTVSLTTIEPSCSVANGSISSMVTGGTSPYTYSWTPGGSTSGTISSVGPGIYNLAVRDSNSCLVSVSDTLTNIPGPSASILSANNVSCFGGNDGSATASVSSGTPPYIYSWAPSGGSTLTGTALTAGNYTLTVTDNLGCANNVSVAITQPTALTVSIASLSNVSCNSGSNGTITVSGNGGTPAYTYSWSPVSSVLPSVSGLSAGTYTVHVTDQNSCTTSISIPVTQPTTLTSAIGSSTNVTCFNGTNGTATASVSGGTIPYSYLWSNGQTGSTAVNLSAGSYTVTITDFNGCTSTNTVLITQPTQVITSAGPNDTICLGSSGTLTATATGGAGGYYYAWQPTLTINSGSLNVSPVTNTTYTVVAYDMNGCVGTSDTVSAIVYNLTAANINAVALVSPICPGQTTTVSVLVTGSTGPLTYSWNNGLGTSPGPINVSPTVNTTYIVSVTNSCGITVMDSVQIVISPPPTVIFSSDSNIYCAPSIVQFFDNSLTGNPVDPIHTWLWDFGDGTTSGVSDPTHVYTSPGSYLVTLTVTTGNGCTSTSTSPLPINVFPYPVAAFSLNSTTLDLPYDDLVCTNLSVGASSYIWSFGDGGTSVLTNPTHPYTTVGSYPIMLIATNIYNCSDTAYSQVTTNTNVVFPNAFTPNDNGPSGGYYDITSLTNDIFFPYASGVVDFKLQIFNRWGELIFETTDFKQGWDGYYHGELCQQDVYVWKAYVRLNNGKKFNKTGDVTLLR
ncbi:MAG: PKD domain-containing protein [Bacteroidia bacterium]